MEEFPAFLLMPATILTMDLRKKITMDKTCLVWIFRVFLMVCLIVNVANACSCMFQHPQDHYCNSDFVALVKVKQRGKKDGTSISYHINIKKEFKVSEKARHALSHRLIWTANEGSLCGVTLKPTRYLITGRIMGEKPWVNLCNFVEEWQKLTVKQKKGFKGLYHQACHCKVLLFSPYKSSNHSLTASKPQCNWETWQERNYDCQSAYSVCVPSSHHVKQCIWLKSRAYRQCMKERRNLLDREP